MHIRGTIGEFEPVYLFFHSLNPTYITTDKPSPPWGFACSRHEVGSSIGSKKKKKNHSLGWKPEKGGLGKI